MVRHQLERVQPDERISLMLLFGTFMLALLTYIDHHNRK